MNLARFTTNENPSTRVGVVKENTILDLSTVGLTGEMKDIIQGGVDVIELEKLSADALQVSMTEINLRAPITNPGKILAIGLQ